MRPPVEVPYDLPYYMELECRRLHSSPNNESIQQSIEESLEGANSIGLPVDYCRALFLGLQAVDSIRRNDLWRENQLHDARWETAMNRELRDVSNAFGDRSFRNQQTFTIPGLNRIELLLMMGLMHNSIRF